MQISVSTLTFSKALHPSLLATIVDKLSNTILDQRDLNGRKFRPTNYQEEINILGRINRFPWFWKENQNEV